MVRDVVCDRHVRRSAEHERASRGRLAAQPFNKLMVVREGGWIEQSAARDLRLEVRASTQKPKECSRSQEWVALHKAEEALNEDVGANQRTVQIDAERNRSRGCLHRIVHKARVSSHRAGHDGYENRRMTLDDLSPSETG